MRSKLVLFGIVLAMVLGMYAFSMADDAASVDNSAGGGAPATTIGGHIKMTLFDTVDGVETKTGVKTGETEYSGFTFNEIILYISQKISDNFSVEVEPEFAAKTGATPKLGTSIGAQMAPVAPAFSGFDRALAKYIAPMDVEISAGIIKPKFTMEYGDELFWDEEFNGSKFAADPWLGEMADSGVEVYKSFDAGGASIPVWLYALNGYGSTTGVNDNNRSPAFMIHMEPAMGMFKLTGSYTVGLYDNGEHDAYQRASGGIQFIWDNLQLRSELANGRWENKIAKGIDAKSYGWYVKAIYKFTPWLKFVYDYSVAELNFNGFFITMNNGGENYLTHTFVLDYNVTDSTYLMLQVDYANWKQNNGSEGLNFIRPTLAVRTTF
jgi:hypothetical protein